MSMRRCGAQGGGARLRPIPMWLDGIETVAAREMSSPGSSLRKIKKSPLPGNKSVPFRHPSTHHPSEDLDSTTQRHILQGIRHHGGGSKTSVPSDSELLGSMATRLMLVERELLAAKKEIVEKDHYIRQLEERLERSRQPQSSSGKEHELKVKCLALQKQVEEMEEFLNDYGMIWVGGGEEKAAWVPEESVVPRDGNSFQVDFDLIIRNIKELNVLAGDGTAEVVKTGLEAQFKPVDPIPLALYNNGIVMFQGPFRPYSDPVTQHCVADLMDGYFPSELQEKFPEGIPFKVSDNRGVMFRPREYGDIFPGSGHSLGGEKGPSKLLPSSQRARGRHEGETSELPGPKVTMETFLSRLPASVIRGGRVIDIRSGISEKLQGSGGVMLVETPVLHEIKSRLDMTEDQRPPTPGHVTTLRVKSELGDQTYILKMKYSDTIGDVRQHLNRLRPAGASQNYQLKCTFPNRTFTNNSSSLSNCSLTPSANLFISRTSTS